MNIKKLVIIFIWSLLMINLSYANGLQAKIVYKKLPNATRPYPELNVYCENKIIYKQTFTSEHGYWYDFQNKLFIVIESNNDDNYGKKSFNGKFYKLNRKKLIYVTTVYQTNEQYLNSCCSATPLFTMRDLNKKIYYDLLDKYNRIKDINFNSNIENIENFKVKNESDKILLEFLEALKNKDFEKVKNYYGWIGGPREKPGDFEEAVDSMIVLFSKYELSIIKYWREKNNDSLVYTIYFKDKINNQLLEKPRIILFLFCCKKNNKFSIDIIK